MPSKGPLLFYPIAKLEQTTIWHPINITSKFKHDGTGRKCYEDKRYTSIFHDEHVYMYISDG